MTVFLTTDCMLSPCSHHRSGKLWWLHGLPCPLTLREHPSRNSKAVPYLEKTHCHYAVPGTPFWAVILQAQCSPCHPTNSVQALKTKWHNWQHWQKTRNCYTKQRNAQWHTHHVQINHVFLFFFCLTALFCFYVYYFLLLQLVLLPLANKRVQKAYGFAI